MAAGGVIEFIALQAAQILLTYSTPFNKTNIDRAPRNTIKKGSGCAFCTGWVSLVIPFFLAYEYTCFSNCTTGRMSQRCHAGTA